jgi:hypothetical protein
MTDSESTKKNAKGFAGLSSRVLDVSEDAPTAAKASQAALPAPPAAGSVPPRPPSVGQPARGFAGLSSKVSDVSEDAARAAKERQAIAPAPPSPDARPSQPARAAQKSAQVESSPAPSKSGKTGWAWVVACVAVFVVIWMADSGSRNHGQSPAARDVTTTPLTPMAPGAALDGAAPAVSDERMPPVGHDNVLGITEIRWCKREKVRIDAIEIVINHAVELEVGTFNAKVDDYNSRCAEFRYRRGQVEQVDLELAAERESIATISQSQWYQAWAGASDVPAAAPASVERTDEPQPSAFGSAWGAKPERAPSQTDLSQEEQASIDSACSDQKLMYGNAAFDKCAAKKIAALKVGPRNIDLTALTASERESIESACSDQKLVGGPADYNACFVRKLSALKTAPRNIDLSELSQWERESMESSCSDQKLVEGPAAYNRCMSRKLAALRAGPRTVNLSTLSEGRRASIESACSDQKLVEGPAAYNKCLMQKLGRQ